MCSVMWSRVGTTHSLWQPNHFVPCIQTLQEGMSGTRKTTNEPPKPFENCSTARKHKTTPLRSTNYNNEAFPQFKPNHHWVQMKLLHHSRLITLMEIQRI